jgi:hypothetical protein
MVFDSKRLSLVVLLQCVSLIQASLICLWWFDFKREPILATAPDASQNGAPIKSGQNWLENNHLTTMIQILETHCANPQVAMRTSSE